MSGEQRTYTRFSLAQRLEHVVMFTSFIVLAATGLPQKFAEAGISQAIINLFGGIDLIRQIHHSAAAVLILSSAFHMVALGYRLYVKRARPSMLPGLKDVKDGFTDLLYNFGARKDRSQGGRYNWMEKVEYWALVWGTMIMVITGFMLLNPIATTTLLPGEIIPAAKTAHGWEAVLAVVAVIIWHFYSVHLRRFNKSMFTGKMTEHEMLEEHPLELADLKAGVASRPLDAKFKQRQKIFTPVAAVIGVAAAVGILRFMTFEQTAIATIPQRGETVQVFAPLTPTPLPTPRPTSTPEPTQAVVTADWDTVGAVLQKECASCHNGTVAGLDYTTYEGAMKGGNNGPVVKPGDPDHSLIVQKVAGGAHPGKLSPAELQALKTWIANGAPKEGTGAPVSGNTTNGGVATAPTPAPNTWGVVAPILSAQCGQCHVTYAANNLSFKTYQDILKGGISGPAIVPGDPENSLLVKVQKTGKHFGELSPQDLAAIVAWIEAGAPEK